MTWLEIDSKAIGYNIQQFRRVIGKNRLLMVAVKSNAYGHGFFNLAKICEKNKEVDRVCVVNSDEALEMIKYKIKKTIQILSFYELDSNTLRILISHNVVLPLYSVEQARMLNLVAVKLKKRVKVHLKIDTGTSRIGILPDQCEEFIKAISAYKNLEIEGIWSHFASSEDDADYTKKQSETFISTVEIIRKMGIEPKLKHMSCSAATTVFSLNGFNAVRIGLSLYGLYPSVKTRNKISLKPALSWFTKIVQVKTLRANTKIGYGGTFTTKKPTKLAILPIGYWDGYDRRFSNKAEVIIRGKRCPIRGRICMNLCMADVTGLSDLRAGETATLIGGKGKNKISVDDMATWAETINYEIVDRINPLLPRIFK